MQKNINKRLFKSRLFYFTAILLITIGLFSFSKSENPNDNIGHILNSLEEFFSFAEEKSSFFNQGEILGSENELVFSQGNTLVSFSPPESFSLNVLGTLTSSQETLEIKKHIVETGDNLSSIASKYEISTDTIRWANDIRGDNIRINQELAILPVNGVMHLVESGDTLDNIVKKYKYKESKEKLIALNESLESESLYVGDILIIPGGEMPVQQTPITSPSPSSIGFISPAKGIITQGLHWYNAIDIANNCNTTPIYASASGTIQRTGYHHIGGNYIRILHSNNVVTYYGHLSRILVTPGQQVSQGNVIGYMGNTGYTRGPTGCHVHFEVRGGVNPFRSYPRGYIFK